MPDVATSARVTVEVWADIACAAEAGLDESRAVDVLRSGVHVALPGGQPVRPMQQALVAGGG